MYKVELYVRVRHPRFSTGPVRQIQLSRLHHRPAGRHPGTGGRPSPPRRDRERHPGPEVWCRPQPSPLGPLRRQRGLAGDTGDGSQPLSLDRGHRSGRDDGNHQDPAPALLLPGRTHYPQGPPPHLASAPRLALGKPVQQRPGPIACPATPLLTTLWVSDPSSRPPNRLAYARRIGLLCLSLLFALLSSPFAATSARQHPPQWPSNPALGQIHRHQHPTALTPRLSSLI